MYPKFMLRQLYDLVWLQTMSKEDVKDFQSVTVIELLGACHLSKRKSALAHKL
jgi:hypothetical protein